MTSHGERKIIDCIDCSGAGDVDTSVVKTAVDGVVTGLTGRQLKVGHRTVLQIFFKTQHSAVYRYQAPGRIQLESGTSELNLFMSCTQSPSARL